MRRWPTPGRSPSCGANAAEPRVHPTPGLVERPVAGAVAEPGALEAIDERDEIAAVRLGERGFVQAGAEDPIGFGAREGDDPAPEEELDHGELDPACGLEESARGG